MMDHRNTGNISFMGERVVQGRPAKNVYLDGASMYYQRNITQVAPAPNFIHPLPKAFETSGHTVVYEYMKPMILLQRTMGIFPVGMTPELIFKITPPLMVYSVVLFLIVVGYIIYIQWDKVEIVRSAEGRFEEAVIDYLFTVYLVPIVLSPVAWFESRRIACVFNDWILFEKVYSKIAGKKLPLFVGNKPLLLALGLPLVACGTMVITHVTMVHFRFLHVIPYCFINTITYLVGGVWYLHCNVIGKIATVLANDFQQALRNIGPSVKVAEYRSMWMLLSRLTRCVGNGLCYLLTFLCLYLFLIITLTIYGLLSQIQDGLGIKDVGLTITAIFSIGILFFVCDEAHCASNCVRVNFQKKLLLVELSWMNEDAQQEINMFLRATEMNPTDMSLGGFFDVNRNLFKSLLATMVTYLVVLLQFQISIPEDASDEGNSTIVYVHATTKTP